MQLFLTPKIWKEGKYYVAYNPELGVASQGKDIEHAQKMLQEAVSLFLETSRDISLKS
jgi:predicted RNase H-like HicB family nuclease